jgi:hypothetical protein
MNDFVLGLRKLADLQMVTCLNVLGNTEPICTRSLLVVFNA